MKRWLAIGAAGLAVVLVLVLVVTQIALPSYLSGRIRDRLTEHGGQATVSMAAVPALRLLFGEGKQLSIHGSELSLDITRPPTGVLEKLDGFGEVHVDIAHSSAGPIAVRRFALARQGSDPYSLQLHATVSLPEVARFGAAQLGPFASLVAGNLTGSIPPELKRPLVIDQDVRFTSDGGRIVVVSGSGTINGVPTEPLLELITQAIVLRL